MAHLYKRTQINKKYERMIEDEDINNVKSFYKRLEDIKQLIIIRKKNKYNYI